MNVFLSYIDILHVRRYVFADSPPTSVCTFACLCVCHLTLICMFSVSQLTNAIREILSGMEAIRVYSSEEHASQIQKTLCQVGTRL